MYFPCKFIADHMEKTNGEDLSVVVLPFCHLRSHKKDLKLQRLTT